MLDGVGSFLSIAMWLVIAITCVAYLRQQHDPIRTREAKLGFFAVCALLLPAIVVSSSSEPWLSLLYLMMYAVIFWLGVALIDMYFKSPSSGTNPVEALLGSFTPPPPQPVTPTLVALPEPIPDFKKPLVEKIERTLLNEGRVLPEFLRYSFLAIMEDVEKRDRLHRSVLLDTSAPEDIHSHYTASFEAAFWAYLKHLPRREAGAFIVPLTTVMPVGRVISDMMNATAWNEKYGCFHDLHKTINDRYWGISRKFVPEKELAAGKKIMPATYPGTPAEAAEAYLGDTPFFRLFNNQTTALQLDPAQRLEHQFVLAPSGTGKTQLLQAMIAEDIERVLAGQASVVIIDSQGVQRRQPLKPTLIENIIGLKAVQDRLTYIKPSKSLALNIFDAGQNDPDLTQEERDIRLRSIREMVALSLGGATELQFQMLKWCMRLALLHDAPNIHVLRRILSTDQKAFQSTFRTELKRADETTRQYFANFFDGTRLPTKQALTTRIDGFIEDDAFRAMLDHPTNAVRMIDEIEASRIVVVDADKAILGKFGTEAFGRFFIAQLLFASRQRKSNRPVYIYIDEAHDFISNDENISELLTQARKQDVGLILATQTLTNINSSKVRENVQDVAILITHDEAKPAGTFTLKLRGRAEPIEVTVPRGVLEDMEKISAPELEALQRSNAAARPAVSPRKPPEEDDDDEPGVVR